MYTARRHNAAVIAAGPAMPTPSPAPSRRQSGAANWRPTRRTLWWVLLAFAIGLVLFALVWSGGRGKPQFYRAGDTPPTAAGRDYAPLPVPLAARGGGTGDTLPTPDSVWDRAREGERPQLVEAPPPPPAPPVATAPTAPVPATGQASQPQPIAGRAPAPGYPRQALRRGERGTVMVRAEIGPDGVPGSVSVARSSGSRLLDRAAVDAVVRWRFRPAQLNGQPTVGTVMVPIEFQPD